MTVIVKTYTDYKHLEDFIRKGDTFALDIETSGLNSRKDIIIGYGLSNKDGAFYVPSYEFHPTTNELVATGVPQALQIRALELLQGKQLITWNGSFDLPFIKNFYGVDLIEHLYIDGMLLKHTLDENFPFSLKDVAVKILGPLAKQDQSDMLASVKANGGTPKEYFKADLNLLAKYCISDCRLTYKLYEHYFEQLHKEGKKLVAFFFEEVMPLYKEVTIPMEECGIKLDVPLMEQCLSEIKQDMITIEAEIQADIAPLLAQFNTWYLNKEFPPSRTGEFAQGIAEYGQLDLPKTKTGKYELSAKALNKLPDSHFKSVLLKQEYLYPDEVKAIQELLLGKRNVKYAFNLLSKHHLKKLFFEKLKENPINKTDKGNPQVDEEFLELMSKKYTWCEKLIIFNKLTKIKSTYIERFLEEQENGRFYPSFQQHRTVSGRYGSDLQQLPRPLEEGQGYEIVRKYTNQIRKFFIADAGRVFVDADYESLEPHVFAHVSGDERIKDIFRQGLDFYSTIAIRTERLTDVSADKQAPNFLGKVDKAKRQRAKAYSLGIPYGMSGYKLQFEINVTQEEAEQLVEDYLKAFPDLKAWMDRTAEQVKKRGRVESEVGRVRHMPEAAYIYRQYGDDILDSLALYKEYHEHPSVYEAVKLARKAFKNYLNNGNNFQIQSLSSSIVNRATIAINRWLKAEGIDGRVIAQIHDQIITDVPEQYALLAKEKIQYIMENTYKLSIALKAPAALGKNFYEAH